MPATLLESQQQLNLPVAATKPVPAAVAGDVVPAASVKTIRVEKLVPQRKVLVVSIPEFGHLLPVVHLSAALARRGHAVSLATCAFAAPKASAVCGSSGVQILPLCETLVPPDAGSGRASELKSAGCMLSLYMHYNEQMHDELKEVISTSKPDVVIVDFMSYCAADAAAGSSAEVIVNFPGPLSMLNRLSSPIAPYLMPLLGPVIFGMPFGDIPATRKIIHRIKSMSMELPWLLNTFWGLEEPTAIPPNLILTGPPAQCSEGAGSETSLDELNVWLGEMRQNNLKVVYVTMGSMVALKDWQVQGIYSGLEALDCAVIWSLKEKQQAFLPESLSKKFFIHKWLPQLEIIELRDVSVVVTHCGWGGFMEALVAGKPIVATPFFGDQPDNAQLAVKRGLAELLLPKNFQENFVQSAIGKVLSDPKYASAAKEVQRALLASGGASKCCEVVEDLAAFGSKALVGA